MTAIPNDEFIDRKEKIQQEMKAHKLDALAVYGDEYRKENLRYVSNFWPIFERAVCFIPREGAAILAGAPEGERYAREMCPWADIRNVREFACVSVPEEIDYPLATFSSLSDVIGDALKGGLRLGIAGRWDMPGPIFDRIRSVLPGVEIVESDAILQKMRLNKSKNEIECLREAGRLAGIGYQQLISNAIPGNTELMATGAAEGAARVAGAEAISFTVFGSGARTHTIVGRPKNKVINDSDMIMAALAVQYEGYVATVGFPFVAGKASDIQKALLDVLFQASNAQLKYLKPGESAGDMVRAVKKIFQQRGFEQYDVYPPMHGIGLAEAESPYPDVNATYTFTPGMCLNSDISLFGHPAGSNRLEEGFVIQENGPESLTPVIRDLCISRI